MSRCDLSVRQATTPESTTEPSRSLTATDEVSVSPCKTSEMWLLSTSNRLMEQGRYRQASPRLRLSVAAWDVWVVRSSLCWTLPPWCGKSWRDLAHLGEASVSQSVLICDDAIFMRTMLADILQQAGFDVVGEAETGAQAVARYRELRPDLVTMDIVMPDMGGIDAVREITKLDPGARILMCSAMGQQALVIEAIQAGAKDFVVKPFQPSRVLEAIQRVLT